MREDILVEQIKSWTYENIDPNFTFRKYQLEAILSCVQNVLTGTKTQVMEAPTGSGKSFIAIITAGVLQKYYHKSSYILASDLSLYKQYEDAIKKYDLPWGTLKGKDNYLCPQSGKKISLARCSIKHFSAQALLNAKPEEIEKNHLDCCHNCPYINAFKNAAEAQVTLMTYALYLLRVSKTPRRNDNPLYNFLSRDLVIGDEAHNLPSIVQNQFSPSISLDDIVSYEKLYMICDNYGVECPEASLLKDAITYAIKFDEPAKVEVCIKRISELLTKYDNALKDCAKLGKHIKAEDETTLSSINETITQAAMVFKTYCDMIQNYSTSAIVKTVNKEQTSIKLNCAYESTLVKNYFHNISKCELLLSATIGDVDIYKKIIGAEDLDSENFKPLEIPSTFDFSQSPIYYNTKYRMSYKEKQNSLPFVVQQVVDVCNKNKNRRGIIQTGSYDVALSLLKMAPSSLKERLITYKGSFDKNQAIKVYLSREDGILCGPSLLEGLDFAGDKCRFNIFMKMPYASLGDNLVKAKMRLIPEWYSLDVCSKLAQGIGRGVRYNSDWCNTYILDACFTDIIRNKNSVKNLSESTIERLVKLD